MIKKKNYIRVPYGLSVHGKDEIKAVENVLKNSTQMGANVFNFEKKVAKLFNKKYGLMVNSGSSALMLAMETLNIPKGSEVITPVLTFSTTVAPIYQLGLVPHFIGVLENKFIADPNQIEKCINKKTVAIMIPNLLGNIPDRKKIYLIAKKYKLKVIEDSADTIGYLVNGKVNGGYSDVTTNSFYASHIINGAGFGGNYVVIIPDEQIVIVARWMNSSKIGEFVKKVINAKIVSLIKYSLNE